MHKTVFLSKPAPTDGNVKLRVVSTGTTASAGDYTLSGSASSGTLTFATATFTAETASERVTITQIP